ncbi:MAG: glycosyltransferase [Candidatus Microgenomates bacterium]|jgi:glycosyltransferase involved in cell wall biosynthesis
MNISICITTFNEEGTIAPLLDSLMDQSKKAEQIIIVDGGSTDRTVEIIRHYQQKDSRIKLLVEKCSRAKGRNFGMEIAKGDVIAITDAGCVADKDWLKNLTAPFATGRVDISAGFYKMTGNSYLQKAESVFLGVTSRKFGINFLPSTRSMAFTKKAWEEIGGFPEGKGNSAEDTDFNYKAVKLGLKYSRVKSAEVEWGMPETLKGFFGKIRDYAKWDARYGIWWHPTQRLMSHNIKSLFILVRYVIGLAILILSFEYDLLLPVLIILIFIYFYWAYRKVYLEFGDWKVSLWGPVLQITSDFAVIAGFISGIISL